MLCLQCVVKHWTKLVDKLQEEQNFAVPFQAFSTAPRPSSFFSSWQKNLYFRVPNIQKRKKRNQIYYRHKNP